MPPPDHADWLGVGEARERILRTVLPLPAEWRPLEEALGRVLAEPLVSPIDLPLWDNSAMDGFATRADDVRGATPQKPRALRVVDDIPAGGFPSRTLQPGEAARIMTGAPLPGGADGVVRVEHTDGGSGIGTPLDSVHIGSDTDAGRNVRVRGEDVRRGSTVLRAGTVLGPAQIGVAASLGGARLPVFRRPVVAVLASGNELVPVHAFEEVRRGRRIVSSNSYALAAQLAESGFEARNLGIAADTPESVREHLERAAGCDALVTSAGVSVGEHDHLRAVLGEMGARIHFWRVRMRPGSAFAFGEVDALGGIPWFGLPGNPVSTLVTFDLLVRPTLLRMAGHTRLFPPTVQARVERPCPAKPGTAHFLRARLSEGDQGPTVALAGSQSSGALSALAAADALLVVPEGQGGWEAGETAPVIVLGGAPLRVSPGY
ncbi:MAG: molybdopterin molybdotransferase MoeA [Gemmatimonadota bacterium]|jgi:molybdopterin molybdotransferase|nr:molybdopterin molybdotransferase MoeA [Gemmatimonadota bacterium]